MEGLGFFKPLGRIVVVSGGSKFSNIEDLGCFNLLGPIVVASGGVIWWSGLALTVKQIVWA